MVSFHNNPEKYNDPKMLKGLDEQVRVNFVCLDNLKNLKLKLNLFNVYPIPIWLPILPSHGSC